MTDSFQILFFIPYPAFPNRILPAIFTSMLLFLIPYKLYTRLYISQAEYYCNNFLAQSNLALEKSLTDFDEKIQEVFRDSDIQEILRHQTPDSASQYNYPRYPGIFSLTQWTNITFRSWSSISRKAVNPFITEQSP